MPLAVLSFTSQASLIRKGMAMENGDGNRDRRRVAPWRTIGWSAAALLLLLSLVAM